MRVTLGTVCIGALIASCSLLNVDGLVGGDAGLLVEGGLGEAREASNDGNADVGSNEDAGVRDGAIAADAKADADADADATSDACVNLLLNGGFEEQADCRPWANYGGPLVAGTPPRNGAGACRACTADGGLGSINFVTVLTGQTFAAGEVVHFAAWVRAADTALFAVGGNLLVTTTTADATFSTPLLLSNTYQRVEVDFTFPLDGGPAQTPLFQIIVRGTSDAGNECMLLADITACR